jgi:hypothetical protein
MEKAFVSLYFASKCCIGQTRIVTAGKVVTGKAFKPIGWFWGEQDNAHCEDMFPF